MTEDAGYSSIKSLVLDFVHRCGGVVDYGSLARQVKTHFPTSKWQRSHWAWYRHQIIHGRFRRFFSDAELRNLSPPAASINAVPENAPNQPATEDATGVTKAMIDAVEQAVHAAQAYDRATGGRRKLGVTGEVGEILCCHTLGLKLCMDCRSQGFDAIDGEGNRVQIKTRRSESGGLPRDAGRLSTFSTHDFDYALLVLLDCDYRIAEIWRAEHADIADMITSQKRRNPNLASFKRKATRVWLAKSSSPGGARET